MPFDESVGDHTTNPCDAGPVLPTPLCGDGARATSSPWSLRVGSPRSPDVRHESAKGLGALSPPMAPSEDDTMPMCMSAMALNSGSAPTGHWSADLAFDTSAAMHLCALSVAHVA